MEGVEEVEALAARTPAAEEAGHQVAVYFPLPGLSVGAVVSPMLRQERWMFTVSQPAGGGGALRRGGAGSDYRR